MPKARASTIEVRRQIVVNGTRCIFIGNGRQNDRRPLYARICPVIGAICHFELCGEGFNLFFRITELHQVAVGNQAQTMTTGTDFFVDLQATCIRSS